MFDDVHLNDDRELLNSIAVRVPKGHAVHLLFNGTLPLDRKVGNTVLLCALSKLSMLDNFMLAVGIANSVSQSLVDKCCGISDSFLGRCIEI
jgi:hypothetical protein